jgi:hypothetical protein
VSLAWARLPWRNTPSWRPDVGSRLGGRVLVASGRPAAAAMDRIGRPAGAARRHLAGPSDPGWRSRQRTGQQAARMVEWLRERADAPLLVVVDDLHWAEAAGGFCGLSGRQAASGRPGQDFRACSRSRTRSTALHRSVSACGPNSSNTWRMNGDLAMEPIYRGRFYSGPRESS